MRKIQFVWIFIFFCISCSGHDYVEEYEKEEVRDSVDYVEPNDSTQNTSNDSTEEGVTAPVPLTSADIPAGACGKLCFAKIHSAISKEEYEILKKKII